MSVTIICASTVAAQAWRNGGGLTRELLAWPAASAWQVRVSLAQVHTDGPFSAYPEVGRYFAVVAGAGVHLDFDTGQAPRETTPTTPTMTTTMTSVSPPLRFDGALTPACRLLDGPTLDLNLMWRQGDAYMVAAQAGVAWHATWPHCGFFSRVAGVWHDGALSHPLAAHSLVWQQPGRGVDGGSGQHRWAFQPERDANQARQSATMPVGWWLGFTAIMAKQGSAA